MDDRWVVIELSETGIKEYGAFGKAVRAVWGSAATPEPSDPDPVTTRLATQAT
jgi:hypothetical protein